MKRGFTLVELAVVMVLLGIMAAAVAPAFRAAAIDLPAQRGAAKLVRLLVAARATAVRRGVAISVRLVPPRGGYVVEQLDDSTGGNLAAGTLDLDPGVVLAPDSLRPRFVFWPDGTTDGDTVWLRAGPEDVVVDMDPWTGEAHARARPAGLHAP